MGQKSLHGRERLGGAAQTKKAVGQGKPRFDRMRARAGGDPLPKLCRCIECAAVLQSARLFPVADASS